MAVRHVVRLLVIAKSLARHDALFLLELHPAGVTLARLARSIWRPKSVVKGLRPNVKAAFARDIGFLTWMAEQAEARVSWLRRLKPIEVVRTFAETVRLEMDLRFEAASAQELAENFAGDASFRVPGVDWNLT